MYNVDFGFDLQGDIVNILFISRSVDMLTKAKKDRQTREIFASYRKLKFFFFPDVQHKTTWHTHSHVLIGWLFASLTT